MEFYKITSTNFEVKINEITLTRRLIQTKPILKFRAECNGNLNTTDPSTDYDR